MRLPIVYHRFSLFSLSSPLPLLHHHHLLSKPFLPSSSSTSTLSLKHQARSFSLPRHSTASPKLIKAMSASRFHNLVPINAVATEDGGANGSATTTTTAVDDDALSAGYRLPPPELRNIVDAPPLPALSFSPHRDKILFLKRRSLPPLSELARPEVKLAGMRIDGKCNSRSRMSFYTGIGIHQLLDDGTLGPEKEVHGLPDGAKINFITWPLCIPQFSIPTPKVPLIYAWLVQSEIKKVNTGVIVFAPV